MFLPEILLWLAQGGWLMLLHLQAGSSFPKPLSKAEEQRLVDDIKSGALGSTQQIIDRMEEINANYREYQWTWTYKVICDYYGVDSIDDTLADRIHQDYVTARRAWIAEIRKDAEREYKMGDIEESVLNNFLDKLDHEIDYEN